MNFSARTLHFVCALLSALILAASCGHAQPATPTPRIALVIGNAAYADQALATTANDAGLIAQTLEAARLSDFTHALAQTPGRVRIVVIDGARANPYAAEGSPLAPGLALVDPEPGELIAFNAAPGTLAGDEQG